MYRTKALLSVCFCAGLIGALFNSFTLWGFGRAGLIRLLGVQLTPEWTLAWLYPRLVWGGIWGLAYFIAVAGPRSRNQWIRKGLWVSLLPTAFQLFYVFPNQTPHGPMGLGLGTLTPLLVLVFNAVWGVVTGTFARILWGRG
jgi:peptidoglycan/LPS O-acetylase OafA/YrhL